MPWEDLEDAYSLPTRTTAVPAKLREREDGSGRTGLADGGPSGRTGNMVRPGRTSPTQCKPRDGVLPRGCGESPFHPEASQDMSWALNAGSKEDHPKGPHRPGQLGRGQRAQG